MAEVNTDWFKRQLQEKDISQRKLGTLMDLDVSAINLLLHGKRSARADEVARLADILGQPVTEVLENLGAETNLLGSTARVVATIDANGVVKPRKKSASVQLPVDMPNGTVAARNEDVSSLHYGWTVYYLPRNDVMPEAIGRFSICKLKDGRQVCGFLKPGFKKGTHSLIFGFSAGEIETVEVVSASPALWIKVA